MSRFRSVLLTLVEVAVLAIMVGGVYLQANKANTPADIDRSQITSIDHIDQALSLEIVECLIDEYQIGDTVHITVASQSQQEPTAVTLVPYYSTEMLVTFGIVGLVFLVTASFVRRKKHSDRISLIFFALCSSVGIVVTASLGSTLVLPPLINALIRGSFHIAYCIAPLLLLQFSLVFTEHETPRTRSILRAALFASMIMGLAYAVVDVLVRSSPMDHGTAFNVTYLITHASFAALGLASIAVVAQSYMRSSELSVRHRTLWILVGMSTSVLAYVVFWSVPLVVFQRPLLPEVVIVALTIVAPICFAIAIIRYRALDINVIIRFGVIHGLAILVALLLYTVIVTLALRLFSSDDLVLEFIIPVIIILNVLLFAPVRGIIQQLVDRMFFRREYDYRNTLRRCLHEIRETLSPNELIGIITRELEDILQPEFVQVAIGEDQRTEQTVVIDRPLRAKDSTFLGVLRVGSKRSQQQYTEEDIDLVQSIASAAEVQLDRFRISTTLRSEQERARHEAELNRLKSTFVSSVSHDLKTPLTAISMYAELLRTKITDPQATKYLQVIEGESERLARLVNNVLDYAKVERGVMEYDRRTQDIIPVIAYVIDVMRYPLSINNFEIEADLSSQPLYVSADSDALQNVVMDLIANAIKYSPKERHITIKAYSKDSWAVIDVSDRGIGIPQTSIEQIFTAFVRLKDVSSQGAGGAGLGLALVKHFIDAHHGKIEVDSKPGIGTTVRLMLPLV